MQREIQKKGVERRESGTTSRQMWMEGGEERERLEEGTGTYLFPGAHFMRESGRK